MTSKGLPPNFRLNLTAIQKNTRTTNEQHESSEVEEKKIPAQPKKASTIVPPRQSVLNATRQSTTLSRKNLIVESSSDDTDDFDLDIATVPVGQEEAKNEPEITDDIAIAPSIQVNQLPEFDDGNDDFQQNGQNNKFSIIYDLLLTPEQVEEPLEEWSYRTFIKQFANSEANQDMNDDDEEYEMDEDEYSEYD
ncbi:hypothetical protein GPJ56_004996 [Histomonas meleagridis]|uniref:uncharacterized protein n=1 Tax=Histomonas meleagridis TaxID=135588 RepID=UPI00355A487B|nr:hypothetical protein GPJ56_004996 [Histomonas meleagridis]KAH0802440.1 hypothetical protein GO595_004489 [Histomonas meleagridis]